MIDLNGKHPDGSENGCPRVVPSARIRMVSPEWKTALTTKISVKEGIPKTPRPSCLEILGT
jgi:hypothetical protein